MNSDIVTEFRTEFPEFTAELFPDAKVMRIERHSRRLYGREKLGKMYLMAHMLVLEADRIGEGNTIALEGEQSGGEITSHSAGGAGAGFMPQSADNKDTWYTQTPYGQMFLEIRRKARGPGMIWVR